MTDETILENIYLFKSHRQFHEWLGRPFWVSSHYWNKYRLTPEGKRIHAIVE